jgi:hypothetical protein
MLKVIDDMVPDVLAITAIGKVTNEDYRATLIPLAERMRSNRPIRMLYVIGPESAGFEPIALWDDSAFGLKHVRDFSHVAVVTDQPWLRAAVGVFAPFIRARLRLFGVAQLPEAKAWINQPA